MIDWGLNRRQQCYQSVKEGWTKEVHGHTPHTLQSVTCRRPLSKHTIYVNQPKISGDICDRHDTGYNPLCVAGTVQYHPAEASRIFYSCLLQAIDLRYSRGVNWQWEALPIACHLPEFSQQYRTAESEPYPISALASWYKSASAGESGSAP